MYTPNEIEAIVASSREAASKYSSIDDYKRIYAALDVTSLSPLDTERSITAFAEGVVDTLSEHPELPPVASICVYPPFVECVGLVIDGSPLRITSVGGAFPASQSFVEVKALEVAMAVESGADEIDIVLAVGKLLEGADDEVRSEIELLREEVGEDVVLKVIIESGELPNSEIIYRASQIAIEGGADFIKTSTGKVAVGATPEAVVVMCKALRDHYESTGERVGIKVAGGVRTLADAQLYYSIIANELGEEWLTPDLMRFGTSAAASQIAAAIIALS